MRNQFSDLICKDLRFYVYLLRDPRKGKVFYIGMSEGNGVFDELKRLESSEEEMKAQNIIHKIRQSNEEVIVEILRHGLTETQAFEVLAASVDLLRDHLVNKKFKFDCDRGLKSINDFFLTSEADNKVELFDEPSVLITLNRSYCGVGTMDDIYEMTRKSCAIDIKRAYKAEYAIAVIQGIIRGVFKIHSWESSDDGRFEFVGEVAPKKIVNKYLNKSPVKFLSKGAWKNPIRYTF